jgi:peroxiredoxin Q/BCP
VAYFAASADSPETNHAFAEATGADYPILSDTSRKVGRAYGVMSTIRPWPMRWTFYIGLDGRLLDIDRKVNASTAGADIAARLEALGIARAR